MARQNHGPLSRAKGKLGGVVYQQYEGMQIAREYQPVVKNPQTEKQTENRAKFKSASQIVAQFKEVLNVRLAKLSIYTRKRRGAAISAIFGAVEVEPTSASTLFENVVHDINAKSMASVESPILGQGSGNALTITATNGDVVTYVAASYDVNGKIISRTVETFTANGDAKSVNPATGADSFALMVVATRATTEDGRAVLGNISGDNNEFLLDISRAVAAGDVEISDIVGGMRRLS
jgi:hypothetical protein